MADDKTKAGSADRDRINVNQRHELEYWTQKWNVPEERLKEAVAKVGVMVKDVAKHLGKSD
jgi:Protein of unknown function (DUF3606)